MGQSKIPFSPVQGTEAQIMEMNSYNEGYVYFATDTKKIYLDAGGRAKIPMGGNSGIYYGKMRLAETPDSNQVQFEFNADDLEVNENADFISIPNLGDLILNIPDGCFYRVMEVEGAGESATIITNKLTIAGSGGGNSPDRPGSLAGLVLDRITSKSVTTLAGASCVIAFKATATDSSGELTGNGTYKLTVDGIVKARGVVKNNNPDDKNDYNEIDVGPYLISKGTDEANTVKITVSMDTGGNANTEASKTWDVYSTKIGLVWDYDYVNTINSTIQPFTLDWEISGGANIPKTTHIIIDEYHEFTDVTSGVGRRSITINPLNYGLTHGVHRIEMYVTAEVGIASLSTDKIIANAIFADPTNDSYIINCNYFGTKVTQYDTIQIPIVIYSKANITSNATVVFRENGSIKSTKTGVANNEKLTWAYTPTMSGIQVLSIQCGTSEYILQLEVEALGIIIEEEPGYAFKFKANEFADNGAVQAWNSNNVTATFSEKFDWINGGLKTEIDENNNPRQYLCIKAGSTMTINYNVFGIDARAKGKCFKVIFKAAKCKDYDAQVLSCHDGARGLILKAQNGIFNSTDVIFNIPYCEESYIELEVDITANKGDEKRYVRPWIDGVPAGIKVYEPTDDFGTAQDNKLVIGSNDCDVYIYLIKLYESHLSDTSHLNNFIADAPNAPEMVARFRRNDILDENGEISPTKLAVANPDCRVHMYEMSRMTMHKKDPVENCSYTQYHGSNTAALTAEGVKVKVQGTSSAAYGLAAFNLDSDFKKGFTDVANDTHIDKWSMNDNSIPIDFFCTKVNVASAEGANNALNQEWYNRYQPYKTVIRCKNSKARDTMEFTPGVLFIKDLNKTTNDTENGGKGDNVFKDTSGYIDNPYYKMYSVCNMGNSKKNIEVFHDTENPLECCVENGDNQYPGQWMTIPQGGYKEGDTFVIVDLLNINENETTLCPDGKYRSNRLLWENGMDEIYGFRYPDGIKDVKEKHPNEANQMIEAWYRLVDWMAKSNPSEKYALQKYIDSFEPIIYATEEDFTNDTNIKYLLIDEEYTPTTEYVDDATVYYIFTTAEQKFTSRKYKLYTIADNENRTHEVIADDANYNADVDYYRETAHVYGATNEKLPQTVTFGEYKFRGYKCYDPIKYNSEKEFSDDTRTKYTYSSETKKYTKALNFDNASTQYYTTYQEDYTPILENFVVSTYAGSYDYDTTEYRMAKMLSECEDYLCMDSIVFHYLFIERHSMVDNVAKNTFWSTEDLRVWNLTKDYDNDTSDGNNNQGKLELTYGYEPGDIDEGGTSIFNAGNSVWLKFIRELYPVCQTMYNALDVAQGERPSAWSAEAYLQLFKEWQSIIPERCWIEDYYRKYVRPYEVYNTTMFLDMNEGGLKTYQRKQYETYQNYYISSKYFGSTCKTNMFTLRPNGTDLSTFKIPVSLYADCYIHGAFGSGTDNPNFSKRCKRNTIIEMVSPIDNATDATTYLYPSNLYQTLGDASSGLNKLKLDQFEAVGAKKLRTLALGVYTDSTANTSLSSLGIGACENLENLYIARMTNNQLGNLNLDWAPNIKRIDGRNSAFSGFIIANNAPIEQLLVNNPKTLSLSNLTELQLLTFQDSNTLEIININNIDKSQINSKNNIVDIAENLKKYKLTDVQWNIINSTYNNQAEVDGVTETIRILEILKNLDTYTNEQGQTTPRVASLTGVLNISEAAYNSENSINIYNKYAKNDLFPNLDIIFEGSNAKLPKVSIYNGNNEICWARRLPVGTQITDSFLSTGPYGAFIESMISKQPSDSATYKFENKWEIYDKDNNLIVDENGQPIYIEATIPLYNVNITEDIYLKPVFTESIRTYTVRFYDYNPETKKIDKLLEEKIVPWGSKLPEIIPSMIPYKPDEPSYDLKETNNFIGYGLTTQSITPVANDYTVSNEQNFYAIFEKAEDVSTIVHKDWFTFTEGVYQYDEFYSQYAPKPSVGTVTGYAITPKIGLRGKITIPAEYNGKPVIKINNYFATDPTSNLQHNITHVFCEKGSQLLEIGDYAFDRTPLKYFDFSQNTVRAIGMHAFEAAQLDAINFKLSDNLFFVGEFAFNAGIVSNEKVIIRIPSNVTLVYNYGFNNPLVGAGSTWEIGDAPGEDGIIQNYSKLDLAWPALSFDYLNKFTADDGIMVNVIFRTEKYTSWDEYLDPETKQFQVYRGFVRWDQAEGDKLKLFNLTMIPKGV